MKRSASGLRLGYILIFMFSVVVFAGYLFFNEGHALQASPSLVSGMDLFRVGEGSAADVTSETLRGLPKAVVTRVVDGDTVKIDFGEKAIPPSGLERHETLRLLGVDAPELPRAGLPGEAYAQEATEYCASILEGRQVFIARDWDLRDRYGRLLAYIYLADGTCFNLKLIKAGYTGALLTYRFAFQDEFAAAERASAAAGLGLWSISK